VAETPYPKKVLHLPQVLSQEEVARLIDAAEFPFHRILLMTLYATGARRAEVAHLKINDIDSQRMVIHIRGGKGRKDRDVMLAVTPSSSRSLSRGLSRSCYCSGEPVKDLISLLMLCATVKDSATADISSSPSPQVAVIIAR